MLAAPAILPRHQLGANANSCLGISGLAIRSPCRKPLVTLRAAAQCITRLPKAEHDADEWQAAMETLLLVAELDGQPMFARIGIMRAINRHVERVFDS